MENISLVTLAANTTAVRAPPYYAAYKLNSDPIAVGIGLSYSILALPCFIIDVVVLTAVCRARLMRSGRIFILAGVAMIDGMIRLSAFGLYFGPSIVLGRNLGDDTLLGPVSYHASVNLFASWAMGVVTDLLIAIDRLLTIKRVAIDRNYGEEAGWFFNHRNVIIYALLIYPTTATAMYTLIWATPCCVPYFTYKYFSIIFDAPPPPFENVFMDYIARPVAAVCTIIPVFCYIAIFVILRRTANSQITNPALIAKRRKEASNCLQFAYAFIAPFMLWFTFELIPYLPHDPPYWFTLEIYSAVAGCTTTALIQGTMNTTVRRELKRMFAFGRGSAVVHQAPIVNLGPSTKDAAISAVNLSYLVGYNTPINRC